MTCITKTFNFISIVSIVILLAVPSFAGDDILIKQEELAGIIGNRE